MAPSKNFDVRHVCNFRLAYDKAFVRINICMGFQHTGVFRFDSDKFLCRPLPCSYEYVDTVVSEEELKLMMKDMQRQCCIGVSNDGIDVCGGFVNTKKVSC